MIFDIVTQLFQRSRATSEQVTAYIDAYKWIETYKKAEEYDTAIMAARELLLKIKSGITYYINAEKKVMTLASSNIVEVAKAAKDKQKLITRELNLLYEWETKLRKLIEESEILKGKREERLSKEKVMAEIRSDIRIIEGHVTKKEYSQALHLAKKLVSAHYQSKEAADELERVQKLYDKHHLKTEQADEEAKKKDRFFREAWIKPAPEEKTEDKEAARAKSGPLAKFKAWYSTVVTKQKERQEYLKRQKSLKNIEKLLLEVGSISKINDNNKDDEFMNIMESGLTKDISNFKIDGFDFYGKIIGKDKIVGDTFGTYKDGTRTIYYFGDATGHGVQAGFTVSMLTKIFFEQAKKIKNFSELFVTVNNELKAKLQGKVFVTAVFFEHDSMTGRLRYIGAGHDPMYFYHKSKKQVEKIIPGGLAMGVRKISNVSSLKIRDLTFEDGDMLFGYTDGIIEARSPQGELYGLNRIESAIARVCADNPDSTSRIHHWVLEDVKVFMGNGNFQDDVSLLIFKRDSSLDVITNREELDSLLKDLDLSQRTVKLDLRGKTRAEAQAELAKERQKKELKARLTNMEQLYKIGEYARLKQEVTFCYKQGFVDEKMNFYLAKIIKNEEKSKVLKLDERLKKKYEMLKELYDKGEYSIVIRETIDVLYKNGNI